LKLQSTAHSLQSTRINPMQDAQTNNEKFVHLAT
jgi:hypothetical protein